MRIKKGDHVVVITGKDKGSEGVVLEADHKRGRVLVEGCNMVRKHIKPTQQNPEGGRNRVEAPINVSNVMIKDPKTGKPTRVEYTLDEKGKKVGRKTKDSGTELKDNSGYKG